MLGVLLAAGSLVACTAEEPPPPTNSAPVIVPGAPAEEASTIPPGKATPVEEQLRELRDAHGGAFDTLFLRLMVAHHQGALTMVEQVRKAGVNVRAQEIADDVAVTRTDEIHRMRGMLAG